MQRLKISVVYATRDQQWLRELSLERGSSAGDAVSASGLLAEVAELNGAALDSLDLGVYAQAVNSDYLLQDGDRVEIYRPLLADPKEVRRQLALLGKTIGSKST